MRRRGTRSGWTKHRAGGIRLERLENRLLLAREDAFLAAAGETLEVAADQGVLVNDRDVVSLPLAAVLATPPRHGALQLHADGSFHFRADAAFVGTDSFEYLVDDGQTRSDPVQVTLQVLPQPVVINELLSSNSEGLRTRTRLAAVDPFSGDPLTPDWIELRNLAARAIDIGGYHLTDDPADLTKWQLPAGTTLGPNELLVVFTSGRDVTDAALDEHGWLHTNFQLNSDGEYLALTNRSGQVEHQFSPQFPEQRSEVAYGFAGVNLRYLALPTPGTENSVASAFRGYLREVSAGVQHGFFDAPQLVTLSAPDPGSTIRFTLDGSQPTAMTGSEYTGPLSITQTTVVRAAAFQPDFATSPVMTQTYVFLDDVVGQSPQGETPAGWPETSNGQVLNFGMDPDIVDSPEWGPQMRSALTQIPSVSLVTDLGNLFDPQTGIYVNASQDGIAWERPASLELINPDGTPGFQVNAGLRIRGGFSRGGANPKHAFRLFFRSQYGDARLNFPLFDSEGADEFDKIDLRTAQNNAWHFGANRNSFLRDEFSRDTQRDMGRPYKRGRYYHLYLNGQYWGLYETDERAEASFAETYLGGDQRDYDVVKANEGIAYATDGSLAKWNELWAIANRGFEDTADYFAIQGINPDGTDNPQLERHVDIDNLIDYMLLTFYTGNTDGPTASFGVNNFYAIRNRQTRDGWQFLAHDSEHTLLSVVTDNTRTAQTGERVEHFNPRWLHQQLAANAEYRTRFADRLRKHFFDDGVFTPAQVSARIAARAAEIDLAIIAESARWGDVTRRQYTKDSWQSDVDFLLEELAPQRTERVLRQMRDRGLYPAIDAPALDPPGGPLDLNAVVHVTALAGQVYYTLDGSDPRAIGGQISSTAEILDPGESLVLNADTVVHARALDGDTWSALTEGQFAVGAADAGVSLRITEVHYHPAPPSDAELAAGFNDADDFEFIELVNPSERPIDLAGARLVQRPLDDSLQGVAFDFSTGSLQRLGPGDRVVVVEDLQAFRLRYGNLPQVAGQWTGGLGNGGETLTLQWVDQVLQTFAYDDAWYPATDGLGASLELVVSSQADVDRWNQAESWRASVRSGGTPGRPMLIPGDVNGDRVFDSQDLILLMETAQYEDTMPQNSSFDSGDWDGDGDFTSSDLVLAFQYGLFESLASGNAAKRPRLAPSAHTNGLKF